MPEEPLGRVERVTGTAGRVTMTLTGLTYRHGRDGKRRDPYGEFGPDFIVDLHAALPTAGRRGLLRPVRTCPRCDSSLEGPSEERVKVSVELRLQRIPPLGVEVEMPGARCGRCGHTIVKVDDRAVDSELSDAAIAAFDAAGIHF